MSQSTGEAKSEGLSSDRGCDPNLGERPTGPRVSGGLAALFNPKTSILVEKHHPYIANLNPDTLGDSNNAFLHCGDVAGKDWRGLSPDADFSWMRVLSSSQTASSIRKEMAVGKGLKAKAEGISRQRLKGFVT